MKKLLKQINNVLSFALVFVAVAYMNQYHWLENVMRFFTWFMVIQYQVLCAKARNLKPNDESSELILKLFKSYRNREHLTRWLDNLAYIALALFLTAMGHWVLAICWLLIGAGDLSLRYDAMKSTGEKLNE